jgi:hypothetical protein
LSQPANDDGSTWPFASFQEGETWAADAAGPPGRGLRYGVLAALRAFDAFGYEWPDETEKGHILNAIYTLKMMLEEGPEELSWLMAEAKRKGVSWTDIAASLGITRQAAHKRFASMVEDKLALAGG